MSGIWIQLSSFFWKVSWSLLCWLYLERMVWACVLPRRFVAVIVTQGIGFWGSKGVCLRSSVVIVMMFLWFFSGSAVFWGVSAVFVGAGAVSVSVSWCCVCKMACGCWNFGVPSRLEVCMVIAAMSLLNFILNKEMIKSYLNNIDIYQKKQILNKKSDKIFTNRDLGVLKKTKKSDFWTCFLFWFQYYHFTAFGATKKALCAKIRYFNY